MSPDLGVVRKGILAAFVAAAVGAVVLAAAWFAFSGPSILDSDRDGIPDDRDAFPSNPDQTSDSDGDGFGDNSSGSGGDAFPDDATEWQDSDGDGVGDRADVYDAGNAAVRIVIQKLVRLDSTLCDGEPCDIVFHFRVDVDGADPFEPTCLVDSMVYPDVEFSLTEPGATATCDVDERATVVLHEIIVADDGGTELDYAGGPGTRTTPSRIELPPSGYFASEAAYPYHGPPTRLEWRAEIVGL